MEKTDLQDSGDHRKSENKGDKSKPGDVEGSSPELPDVIDPTVVADSVREHTAILVKAFRHCLSSLADSLYSQSIIPEDIYIHAQNKCLDSDERSRALVSCVEARLEIQPLDFKKFVHILKSEPFLATIGSKLVQSYCTFSSIPTSKRPATISPAISHYADHLKGVYRNSPISPDSKWPPTPSKNYINLATVEHGATCRDEYMGKTLRGNIEEVLKSRKEVSIDEILVPDEEGVAYLKLVLVEGAPGIGKSTLAWELCRRWEQGRMKKYSLTVLLRLREKEVQEIESIAELFYPCQSKYKDLLLDEVSSNNGKGVLFVLDGFDELPITLQKEGFLVNLIKGTFLPECTVLVTSRPSATPELLTICRPQIQKHIEVLGFTQESVEEYATSIFSSELDRLQRFKAFISASKNPAINSLMYVPLNAAIIVEIYRDSKSDHLLPRTLTEMYTQLCLTILNRYFQSNHAVRVNEFKDLPGHLYQEFLKLSEVAFEGMRRQEVIIHTLPSGLVHFDFLDAVSSLYGGGSVSYNFLHLTLQEFFAAYHISHLSSDARLALLKECCGDERWNIVWRFVAGLTQFKFFEGYLYSDLFIHYDSVVLTYKVIFIQCLYEANLNLCGLKHIEVDFTVPSLPLDLFILGYCIANLTSEVSWSIRLVNCFMDNLVDGLKTCDTVSNNSNINRLYYIDELNTLRFSSALHCLEHFPLHGITDLTLAKCTITSDLLTKLLPSMTHLKRLSFPDCTFFTVDCKNLSQSSVTSLDIRCCSLTDPSALQDLIDPLTGTLEELGIGDYYDDQQISLTRLYPLSSLSLLDIACAPSSLKSLKLGQPHNNCSLSLLQTNICLTKLEILGLLHCEIIEVVGILEQNKTLEHFTLGTFELPEHINALRDIVGALHGNSTLRSVKVWIYREDWDHKHFSDYVRETYPELTDPRIEYQMKKYAI